jgi:hypothetical protein
MAYDQGIDFRATAGFVTDPSGCDKEIATTANYPRTSAQGNTVGWEDAPGGVSNRSAAVDAPRGDRVCLERDAEALPDRPSIVRLVSGHVGSRRCRIECAQPVGRRLRQNIEAEIDEKWPPVS